MELVRAEVSVFSCSGRESFERASCSFFRRARNTVSFTSSPFAVSSQMHTAFATLGRAGEEGEREEGERERRRERRREGRKGGRKGGEGREGEREEGERERRREGRKGEERERGRGRGTKVE